MVRSTEPIGPEKGLTDNTPLGARIGRVQVAVRPPDPVLMDRIKETIGDAIEKGTILPLNSSLAIRSVDGFYFIEDLNGFLKGPDTKIVSVVNYDPVRRTFILSGSGEVNDLCELIWYGFEAFTTDTIIFYTRGDQDPIKSPDQMDARVSYNISRLTLWKDGPLLKEGSSFLWRGSTLEALVEVLRTISE
jgi:hypothetical protein